TRCAPCSRATRVATTPCATPSPRPRPASTTPCWARCRSSSCSPSPSTSSPSTGDGEVGQTVLGLGTDLVEVDRFRRALARRSGFAERLFSDDERRYASEQRDPAPTLAARFAAKEA